MSLKSTRKILSVIFIFIIAVGGCLFTGTLTLRCTVCSERYVQRYFNSDKVMQQCQTNFDSRIEALAERSGIPVRAFEAVVNFDEIKSDSPVKRLFGGHDTTLYTKDSVDRFEQLCTEYLEGNSIKYDKALVHNAADEAARIYADCFGMKNTDGLIILISTFNDNFEMLLSISLFMMLFPIVLLLLVYNKSKDILLNVSSAFITEGITLVFTGAAGLLLKWGVFDIYPLIYAQATSSVIRSVFVILMIIGGVIVAGFTFFNVAVSKKQDKKNGY
ncbi:MAG: hypothetical protein ACI4V4_00710 [Eubacterium sp.]